ncbi:MAG: hypothetical protein JST39_13625, partial [Bacteroidetes bacterium]|nr:hypothetical protein [Bacteroidota bacterium]
MLTLYRITRRHPVYFACFLVFISIASIGVCCTGKIDSFIRLNTFHAASLDIFFLAFTYLGDGIFSLLMAALVLLFWKDFRLTIHIVIAYLASGLVAQVMKSVWSAPRP